MHVEVVPNRGSHPTILLRESYREGGKVKKRTLGNITSLPPEQVEGIRRVLKGLPPTVGSRGVRDHPEPSPWTRCRGAGNTAFPGSGRID